MKNFARRLKPHNSMSRVVALSIMLLQIGSTALAAPGSGAETLPDTDWIKNNPRILADAMKLTKTLPRDIVVYHWVPRKYLKDYLPQTGSVYTSSQAILDGAAQNIAGRMARFWNTNLPVSGRSESGGAQAPNGFYVATEPFISAQYGNVLYQMTLPKGARYLDGRSKTKMGTDLRNALIERGCSDKMSAYDLIKSDKFRDSYVEIDEKECRQALLDITAATESAAIGYIFKSEPIPACSSVNRYATAFVLVDESSIAVDSLKVMIRGTEHPSDGLGFERAFINGVFRKSPKADQPFPDPVPMSDEQVGYWMKNNFFRCNKDFVKQE